MLARTPTRRLDPSRPAADALRRSAGVLLRNIRKALAAPASARAPAIHAARRNIKALRALIRLADPRLKTGLAREDHVLRDAARQISGPRDARVIAQITNRLACRAARSQADALQRLADWAKTRAAESEQGQDTAARLNEASQSIDALSQRLAHWPLPQAWKDVTKSALHALRRSVKLLAKGLDQADAEILHEARTWVVRHRYQMAFLAEAGPSLKRRSRRAQNLRDALGKHHDLWVLRQLISRAESGAPLDLKERAKVLERIDQKLRASRRLAKTLAPAVVGERPRRLQRRLQKTFREV